MSRYWIHPLNPTSKVVVSDRDLKTLLVAKGATNIQTNERGILVFEAGNDNILFDIQCSLQEISHDLNVIHGDHLL